MIRINGLAFKNAYDCTNKTVSRHYTNQIQILADGTVIGTNGHIMFRQEKGATGDINIEGVAFQPMSKLPRIKYDEVQVDIDKQRAEFLLNGRVEFYRDIINISSVKYGINDVINKAKQDVLLSERCNDFLVDPKYLKKASDIMNSYSVRGGLLIHSPRYASAAIYIEVPKYVLVDNKPTRDGNFAELFVMPMVE